MKQTIIHTIKILIIGLFFTAAAVSNLAAQCTNASSYGSGAAPGVGATTTLTTCQYGGEYATVTGVVAATNYTSGSSIATDYITIHQGTPAGPVIAAGVTPLVWRSTVAGTYYQHCNTNITCGTQSACRTTTISQGIAPLGCTSTSSYGSAVAPTTVATVTITTCQYAGEYATISSCVANAIYSSASSTATDWITIHQGTSNGPIIAAGVTPLIWSCPSAGTYYQHCSSTSSCLTVNSCRTTTISCPSCAPAFNPCTSIGAVSACAVATTTTTPGGNGVWADAGGGWYPPGLEKLYTFTPTITGNYSITGTAVTGAFNYFIFSYKAASIGCNATSWTYISYIYTSAMTTPTFAMTAGVQYYFLVDEYYTTTGSVTWNLNCPSPPPANDDPCGAVTLTAGATCVTTAGTTTGAVTTVQAGVPTTACAGFNGDVWYKFVATSTSTLVETYGAFDALLVGYTLSGACGSGTYTQVGCDDDNGPGAMSGFSDNAGAGFTSFPLATTIGTTYYLRLANYGSSTGGAFTICVYNAPMPPDPCLTILASAACGTPQNTTLSVTGSGWNNICFGYGAPGQEQIYTYTCPTTGVYTITQNSMTGSSDYCFYSYKNITAGGCTSTGFTCLDGLYGGPISCGYTMALTAGETYYILLDHANAWGSTGTFTVNWQIDCASPPLACPTDLGTGYVVVPSIPYLSAGRTTVGKVNDITQNNVNAVCGLSFFYTGEDEIFEFTVPSSGNYDVVLTNTSGSASVGITLYNGCPLAGNTSTCVGQAYNYYGNTSLLVNALVTGQTYYLLVDSWTLYNNNIGTYTIDIHATPVPPVNDNCGGAITLTPGATCVNTTGTTIAATSSGVATPCFGNADDDVWYQFTATGAQTTITGSNAPALDLVLQLYSGSCGGTSLACMDNTGTGGTETMTYCTTVGVTYWVRVYGYWTGTYGTFSICVVSGGAPPANDECVGAVTLIANPSCSNTTGTLLGASNCGGLAGCTGTDVDDVWYQFVAGATNPTVTVSPSKGLDAVVQVYSGACGGLGTLVCQDGGLYGQTEYANLTGLITGNTYYIRVYDYYGGSATTKGFVICVTNPTIPASPPANDDCAGAILLTPAATCGAPTSGTTDGATQTLVANATCSGFIYGNADDDVWYMFTATQPAHTVTVDAADPLDPVIEIYSGGCGALTSLVCEDASAFPYNNGIEALGVGAYTVGQTYYVRVYGYGQLNNTKGTFDICVTDPAGTPPANDNCPGTTLSVSPGPTCTTSQSGTVLNAYPSIGVPAPCSGTPDDDVWYSFTATQVKHDVTVTPAASFDAVVQVFTGACGSLTNVACGNLLGNGGVETLNLINLTIGTVYRVRVFDAAGSAPATPTFSVCVTSPVIAPPPSNDGCAGAILLAVGASCTAVPGTVESATASGVATVCAGTPDDDVWYKFVATGPDNLVEVQGSVSFNAVIQLYSGASCGALTSLQCANVSGVGGLEVLSTSCLLAGQTYYVRVYDFATGEPANPTFNICVHETGIIHPANDDCGNAIVIGCGDVVTGTTVNAGSCNLPGACAAGNGGTPSPGVWYKFLGNGAFLELSTCAGTSYDTKLHAYTGTCGAFTCIASNDDVSGCGSGLQSKISFLTTVGTYYYVLVNGWAGATGPFTLTVNCYFCTASSAGGVGNVDNSTPVVNDGVIVSVSGNVGNVSWWEYSEDNFVSAPIVLANSAFNSMSLIINSNIPFVYLRAAVQNGPACLVSYSSTVVIKPVCAPAIYYSSNNFGDCISNVTLNTLNHNSTYDASGDMYQDFTNFSTNVTAGLPYTMSITPLSSIYSYMRAVWIDANDNGVFSDPGENVLATNDLVGYQTYTITIPCNAVGTVKMRVLIADNEWYGNFTTASTDPCYAPADIAYDYGEIEEYSLIVAPAANLTVTPVGGSVCAPSLPTIVLTATGGNAGSYAWAPTAGIVSSTCTGTSCGITVQNTGITFYTVTGTVSSNSCPGLLVVPVTTVPVAGVVTTTGGTIVCATGLFSTKVLTVTGAAGTPIQWQSSANNISWTDISGATNTTYTTVATASNTYYRALSMSPVCYDISSNTILIEVSAVPTITIGTITSTSIVVNWTPVGSGNYTVSWNGTAGSGTATGAVSPYTITGLTGGLLANITVSQSNPGSNCFPASATVTNVLTLCAPPPAPTFGATTPTTTVVNIPAGSTSYKVYYRFIAIYNNYVASPCIAGGGAYTIVSQWAGQPISVYLQACNCPTTQNGQAGPAVIKYLLPGTSGACTAPTPFALAQVTSDCPNRIQVDLQGSPNNNYRVTFQRLLPVGGSANSYPVLASGIMNYTVSNTPLPQVWQVWAVSACGPNATAPYSTMTDVITVTVKSGCNKIQNLLLSHATCHGFTATWNVGDCGVPSTNLLGYHCFVKAGTGNWNAYGSTTNVKTGSIWGSGLLMQVYVRANSCNGSFGQSSDIQTIMTLSGAGCREEDQQVEESLNHDGVTTEYGTLSVYPNPNQGQFVMDLQMGDVTTQDVRIEVMNMLGQIVMTQITSISDGHLTEGMGLSENIASGNYMVRVMAGEKAVFNTRINISK